MTWDPRTPRLHTTCTPQDTRGPKRLWTEDRPWVQRCSGDVGHLVSHDYLCPVHGRFVQKVPSGAVPDEVTCPLDDITEIDMIGMSSAEGYEAVNCAGRCGLTAPWSPGSVAVWHSSGEVEG